MNDADTSEDADDEQEDGDEPEPETEIEATLEVEAEAESDPEVEIAYDVTLRAWFDSLDGFTSKRLPIYSAQVEQGHDDARASLPAHVRLAEDAAMIACLEAIKSIAEKFTPPLPVPFKFDVSGFGRDQ